MTALERLERFAEQAGRILLLSRRPKNDGNVWTASFGDDESGAGTSVDAACAALIADVVARQRHAVELRKARLAEAEEAATAVLEWL